MKTNSVDYLNEELKTADNLHFHKVARGKWVGWNRYYPVTFVLNREAKKILDDISRKKRVKSDDGVQEFIGHLKKTGVVFEGKKDPSKEQFMQMVRQKLEAPEKMAREFYSEEQDYEGLTFVNDRCNLACSYCVKEYKNTRPPAACKSRNSIKAIDLCIDQFMARKIKYGRKETTISFNGGEILLDWPIIKYIVEKVSTKYKDIEIKYIMNTNLTLMTQEIAQFCNRHNFNLSISIDGYKAAHNRTRKFHNGGRSFDKIIKSLQLYNQHNPEKAIRSFQGTIEFPDMFRPEQVYRMKRYGFVHSRLAPNLLDAEEEDAVKKAKIMGAFLKLNTRHSFQVTDAVFRTLKKRLNQDRYDFGYQCKGLSCLPKFGVELNISTLRMSLLCGFIDEATVSFDRLNDDIYNPVLWETARNFLHRRMESLFENCIDCELVGICGGGCILSGLDSENKVNKASCTYQKEVWKMYIEKVFRTGKPKLSASENNEQST
jgi:radical SAM protein with 4Fe4S-binding SPASM domain